MNQLSLARRVEIVGWLIEGNSQRAIARRTKTSLTTIQKLSVELGEAAREFHDTAVQGLHCAEVECDEMWSFVYKKDKNLVAADNPEEVGTVWKWWAIDAASRCIITWHVGQNDFKAAQLFMYDLAARVLGPLKLYTDGNVKYLETAEEAFGTRLTYGRLVKQYDKRADGENRRYTGSDRQIVRGDLEADDISTSYVERFNLTTRMGSRRLIRRTNGFSKKLRNHKCSVALWIMYYNFCRPHGALENDTPAMAAGVADYRWELEELVERLLG